MRFIHEKVDACILKSPSPQRLVEYALAVCRDRTMFCPYEEERDKLIGLGADVLRNDEANEKLPAAEPLLKNLLIVLESDQPVGLLQLALNNIPPSALE